MKRGIKPLRPVSPVDGQTIHGCVRPVVRSEIPEWIRRRSLAGSRPLNPLAARPETHQFSASFHAMRLTSDAPSLQSP